MLARLCTEHELSDYWCTLHLFLFCAFPLISIHAVNNKIVHHGDSILFIRFHPHVVRCVSVAVTEVVGFLYSARVRES